MPDSKATIEIDNHYTRPPNFDIIEAEEVLRKSFTRTQHPKKFYLVDDQEIEGWLDGPIDWRVTSTKIVLTYFRRSPTLPDEAQVEFARSAAKVLKQFYDDKAKKE